MPESTKATEVREAVEYYKEQPDLKEMHATIRRHHDLLTHQLIEHLPEHFTRGDLMPVRFGTLAHLLQGILADTVGLPTTTEVVSMGREYDTLADRVERGCALWRAKMDEGRRVTQEVRSVVMTSAYAVMLLRCFPPEHEGLRWAVEVPDPLTCYFPIKAGPLRPEVMCREYEMLVKDVETTFKGSREYGAGKRPYLKKGGKWDFVGISDDYPDDAMLAGSGSRAAGISRVKVYERDDGKHITTAVFGLGEYKDESIIVQEVKNLTGGVRAVVLPHTVLPVRGADRFQAGFWPAYQDIYILNHLRTMRATRSLNAKPDVIIEMSPDQITAMSAFGGTDAAQLFGWFDMATGTANIVRAPGKPTLWEMLPDPEMDKSIEDAKMDLMQIIQGYSEVSETTAKEINTNVYLPYLENRKRKLSPMLTVVDWGWTQMTKMMLHSIKAYNETFSFTAQGGEHRGQYSELKAGDDAELGPEDVNWDAYQVSVVTRSESDAELRARTTESVYLESIGLKTHRQVIEERYPDATRQLEALAEDSAVKQTAPFYDGLLYPVFSDILAEEAGVLIPPPVPGMTQLPTGGPSAGTTYNTPVTPGPAGAEPMA